MRNLQLQFTIEHSQTTTCIQYNIHDTKSCELPIYLYLCTYVYIIRTYIRIPKNSLKRVFP